jgi:hypothetical protein
MNPALAPQSILVRTSAGARRMATRSTELAPKLRSVLFLVSGRISFGNLLERAGSLRGLLESQIRELIRLGLLEIVGAESPAPNSGMLPDLPPVAGAKIQLLKRLEASGSSEAMLLADELLDARTLRELAERARDIAVRLQEVDGRRVAETFWEHAKGILVRWRDFSAAGR